MERWDSPHPPADIGIGAKVPAQARSTQKGNQTGSGEESESDVALPPLHPLVIR